MKKLTRIALLAISAATLVACGGGGGESSPSNPGTPTPPANSSSLNEIPLQLAPGQNAYPLASFESQTFERLNRARTECGLGALTQDTRLDRAAEGHSKYIMAKTSAQQLTHTQDDTTSTFFTGRNPEERARMAGYLNANMSNGVVSEGIAGGSLLRGFDKTRRVYDLLNAPYHALDLLAPRQHVGISIQTPTSAGTPDRLAGSALEDSVLVVNVGSTTDASGGKVTVQKLPVDELLSWPCTATSTRLAPAFAGEDPDPFRADGRDLASKPAGHPFYLMARHGSKLRVTSAKLTNLTTGRVVPLLPPRHSDTERDYRTNGLFSTASLMDWAFIFPDERIEAGVGGMGDSRMRMEVTATVNGKPISKTVEYTVSWGGPDR